MEDAEKPYLTSSPNSHSDQKSVKQNGAGEEILTLRLSASGCDSNKIRRIGDGGRKCDVRRALQQVIDSLDKLEEVRRRVKKLEKRLQISRISFGSLSVVVAQPSLGTDFVDSRFSCPRRA
jgi:hypothetical protein